MKRFEHTIQRSTGIHAGTARSIIRIARQYPGTTINAAAKPSRLTDCCG